MALGKSLRHNNILLGCPKILYGFLSKIKGIFFTFTNNFLDLDILSMSAVSHVVITLIVLN